MDTSKEYIDMCRKAVELQDLWEPMEGDFILNTSATPLPPSKRFIYVNYLQQPFCNSPHWELITTMPHPFLIWLPRQDQLQNIIQDFVLEVPNIKAGVCYWSNQFLELNEFLNIPIDGEPPESWEQVWLSFAMYKLFNKTWENGAWKSSAPSTPPRSF